MKGRRGIHDVASPAFIHNRQRVFGAGIITRQYDKITGLRRSLPHERPFGPVSVAAATEQSNDALRIHPARHRDHVAQGVIGMRIVHRHHEWLAFVDAFESARHRTQGGNAACDGFRRDAVRKPRSASRQNVIDVDLPEKRRFH